MGHLIPCPGCARHVRAGDASCPFCGATIAASAAPRAPATRLGRAATFAFGAAVVTSIGVTGCSESTTPGADAGPRVDAQVGEDGGPAPLYGGPPDSGSPGDDAGPAPVDAGVDSGGPAPAYGAPPPIDGGQIDSGGGGPMPLYGGPPGD